MTNGSNARSSVNLRSSHSRTLELAALQAVVDTLRLELAELHEDQMQIETSRDDYAEIVDLAPSPMLTVAWDGTIRSANLAAAELFEHERGMLILQRLCQFVHEADREHVVRHLQSRGRNVRGSCEARLTFPNGKAVPVQISARTSWRRPDVQHVSIVDLRDRELDAWEKQELKEAARRAGADNNHKDELLAMLHDRLSAATALAAWLAGPATTSELNDALELIRHRLVVASPSTRPSSVTDSQPVSSRPSGMVPRRCLSVALGSRFEGVSDEASQKPAARPRR